MATVTEERKAYAETKESERIHNKLISARYQELKNATDSQLNARFSKEAEKSAAYYPRASVLTKERPAESVPTQKQREFSAVFTAETIDNIIRKQKEAELKAKEEEQELMAASKNVVETATVQQESYALNGLAKAVIAIAAAVVVILLSIIGLNSKSIRMNGVKIEELETITKNYQIDEAELQKEIDYLTSPENIYKMAVENGYEFNENSYIYKTALENGWLNGQ